MNAVGNKTITCGNTDTRSQTSYKLEFHLSTWPAEEQTAQRTHHSISISRLKENRCFTPHSK